MRHYKRRSRGMSPVITSYKKVLNIAPTSRVTGQQVIPLSVGKDSITAGQVTPIDADVPTGAIIKGFLIQYGSVNLTATANFSSFTIQLTHSGQSGIDPRTVGGSPQRNQVFWMALRSQGLAQSLQMQKYFKIPKSYQRVREGDQWSFIYANSATVSDNTVVIYKFYR